MSKAKSGSEKGDKSGNRWASSVTISDNVSRQGVELYFDNEPHPELQSKLRVLNFLPSKNQSMWYAKATDKTSKFAENLKLVLPMSAIGPDLIIQPSYESGKANIENKRFSFILISLKDGQEKSFVVFEPSKPRAEVIAANFAYKNYGKDYLALAVSPKSKMREARMLFDENKIIRETENEESVFGAEAKVQEEPQASTEQKKQPESLQVTFGGEKANVSLILHEFHSWLKDHAVYKGSTKVARTVFSQWLHEQHPQVSERDASTIWDRHQRLVKIIQRIGKLDTKQIHVEPYSSIYKKLITIIPGLMEHLESGEGFAGKSQVDGYMDLHFDYLFKDKQGYNIALAHYYEQNGDLVADPDMQIRIIPEMNMAEAMTFQNIYRYDEVYHEEGGKELVNLDLKRKLNSYLEEWVNTLISYGHSVKLVRESERHSGEENEETTSNGNGGVDIPQTTEPVVQNEISKKSEKPEEHKNKNEGENEVSKRAYALLKKFIPGLDKLIGKKTEATLAFTDKKEKRSITCFFSEGHSQLFIVEHVDDDKQLESDIRIEPENEEARVTAEWLSDYYGDRYDRLDEDGELDGDDMAIGEDMTRGLAEWLEELIEDGHTFTIDGTGVKNEQQPDVFREAYDSLKRVIPDMDLYLKGKRKKVSVAYEVSEEKRELTCEFIPNKSSITLLETIGGKKQMDSALIINIETKGVQVGQEWLSSYYSEGLGRHEPDADVNEEKDKTRALVQWLKDLLEIKLTISIGAKKIKSENPLAFLNEPLVDDGTTGKLRFNPVVVGKLISENQDFVDEWRVAYTEDPKTLLSKLTREEVRRLKDFYNTFILGEGNREEAYRKTSENINDYFEIVDAVPGIEPAASFERTYPPTEEKRILDGFNEMGFKAPFTVKEAFMRKYSVTDVGLRFQSTEQYYKKEIAVPARKKEKALIAEQKEHKYKAGTKKEASIRSEQWELGVRLLRGEEYYKRENEIFKDDFCEAVLMIVSAKGFTFGNQADLESFIEFIDSSVFDEKVFEDYHRQPIDELIEQLIGEYFHEQAKSIKSSELTQGSLAIDIVLQGKAVPNVLVPAETKEPFWSNNFSVYDMEEVIKNNFPHLKKLTSATLFKATPIEMYELVQMSHPNNYGLKINRSSVLREWERRGKELFEGIGYPTDPDYPYVNINMGYTTVETLNQQLNEYNKDGNHWWCVVENNRPIADLAKAADYITQEIQKQKTSIRACVNPKTNKPKADQKEEYRQLNFDMKYLQSGKLIIEDYLKKKGVVHKTKTAGEAITAELRELSGAFWKSEDEAHPANKAVVYGQAFDLARLRKEIERLLGKLSLPQQQIIIKALSENFPLAYDLEKYAKGLVTIGKAGAKREKAVLASFMDTIIRHYDLPLKGKRDYKVCRFLIDKLLSNNEHGQNTVSIETAQDLEEYIEVPFPKTTQFKGSIILLPKPDWSFTMGTIYSKGFGSQSFRRSNLGDNGKQYTDRNAAIKDGLLELQDRLRYEMQHKDSVYNSEAKKNMKVKKALDALQAFAKELDGLTEEKISAKENTHTELAGALWLPADNQYPVDKAVIEGITYHQARLREILISLIGKLQMEKRLALAEELSERFKERRPMQEYFSEKVNGTGKFGKKNFTGAYFDDMIIDNDLKENSVWPVCNYLIAALLNQKENLVDNPIKEKPTLRKITKTDQHQLNKQIEALIDEKEKQGASLSAEEKELIKKYTGSGGLMKQGAKGRGVLYEYYTPEALVAEMWGLARKYGYDGGSVLEPSVGVGNFLKYAPKEAIVFGFETNHYSARIAQVLYPNAHIHEKAFESLFFAGNIHLKDKIDHALYSLVIGNPPYGEFTGKYAGMGEKKWTGALEYDQYFMLRGLDLLQPGGLMVFLVPSLFIQSAQKYNKTKDKIFQKAEVLTCYRLPQNIFSTTDIGTDIIVLKKRGGAEAIETPAEGIDEESLPTIEARKSMNCDITGLSISSGDRVFHDKANNRFIKYLKIKGGDSPGEIVRQNPWLSKIIKELFSNYMNKHGERNELQEKYYSEDAIYDPSLIVDAGIQYIYEVMLDNNVSSCWLHKIDITEAFAD